MPDEALDREGMILDKLTELARLIDPASVGADTSTDLARDVVWGYLRGEYDEELNGGANAVR